MLSSRRDYFMRIIEEVGRLLSMAMFKRQANADQDALDTVVFGFTRLFQMDADQIFLLTPDQHYKMLADESEGKDLARDKILLYAALSAEAGQLYSNLGVPAMARMTRTTALRFVLRARADFSSQDLPSYAPDPHELMNALADQPLDSDTAELVAKHGPYTSPP
jgi:hypothetical protein